MRLRNWWREFVRQSFEPEYFGWADLRRRMKKPAPKQRVIVESPRYQDPPTIMVYPVEPEARLVRPYLDGVPIPGKIESGKQDQGRTNARNSTDRP